MEVHFLGVKWDNSTFQPSLSYRLEPNKGEPSQFELHQNEPLCMKIHEKRFCIGAKGICPLNTDLTGTHNAQCYRCNRDDSTQFLSLAGLTHEQVEILKTMPHFNYVNLFGDSVLKTGVASLGRKYSRVLEQAAQATLYFTACDGYVARQIERYVSVNLHIKQGVSWDTKLKLLKEKPGKTTIEDQLSNIYFQIKQTLTDDLLPFFNTKLELFINPYLMNFSLNEKIKKITYINGIVPGSAISGTLLGVYGKILMVENRSEICAINTDALLGYMVTLKRESCGPMSTPKTSSIQLENDIEAVSLF